MGFNRKDQQGVWAGEGFKYCEGRCWNKNPGRMERAAKHDKINKAVNKKDEKKVKYKNLV